MSFSILQHRKGLRIETIVTLDFIRNPRPNLPLFFESSAAVRQVQPISSSSQICSIPLAVVKEGQQEPRFYSRVCSMPKYATIVRFGSVLASATVLLLNSGCRSTSASTARSADSGLGTAPPAPFFRSYERSSRPYDDDQLAMPPAPPMEVPPVPGYSEPEVPPTPTSQKRRRPWNPAAKRPQPVDSQDSSIDPTGARIFDQTKRISQDKSERSSSNSQNSIPQLQDLPVPLHPSTSTSNVQQWPQVAAANNGEVSPGHSELNDVESVRKSSKTPGRTGTTSSWPDSKITVKPRLKATDAVPSESVHRQPDVRSSASRGSMPDLLPEYR